MKAIANPAEVSTLTVQDITEDIQTGAASGTVLCSVALDDSLVRLGDQSVKLKRTIHLSEMTRKKHNDLPAAARNTALLLPPGIICPA